MPAYATQAMRREFVNTCDMFLGNVEKSRVRRIYKEFTGDSTADESEIDARVKLAFDWNLSLISDILMKEKYLFMIPFGNTPKNS